MGRVQEQVVPEDAWGAQLALVQGGPRVRGGVGSIGRRRWRDEERLGPVPEFLLLRQGLEGLLNFCGDGWMVFPWDFLE